MGIIYDINVNGSLAGEVSGSSLDKIASYKSVHIATIFVALQQ